MASGGFRPLDRMIDPERERLEFGEVRLKCTLNKNSLGWTYDSIDLHQKYENGRQGVFLSKVIVLSNGTKVKLRVLSQIE